MDLYSKLEIRGIVRWTKRLNNRNIYNEIVAVYGKHALAEHVVIKWG